MSFFSERHRESNVDNGTAEAGDLLHSYTLREVTIKLETVISSLEITCSAIQQHGNLLNVVIYWELEDKERQQVFCLPLNLIKDLSKEGTLYLV